MRKINEIWYRSETIQYLTRNKDFSTIICHRPSWRNLDYLGKRERLPEGLKFNLCKFTRSTKDVLRGLHGCFHTWKYMSVPHGKVKFVVADVRKDSPNFLKWDSFVLSSENHVGVLVPPGFVNGHLCISDACLYHYMMSYDCAYIEPNEQVVLRWDDERLNINWPVTDPILSERDKSSNI